MDFTKEEIQNFHNIMTHSIWGLNKEDLIDNFQYGPIEYIQERYKEAKGGGIILQPTNLGVELFMWAYGQGRRENNDFFLTEIQFNNDQNIKINGSIPTKKKNVP